MQKMDKVDKFWSKIITLKGRLHIKKYLMTLCPELDRVHLLDIDVDISKLGK